MRNRRASIWRRASGRTASGVRSARAVSGSACARAATTAAMRALRILRFAPGRSSSGRMFRCTNGSTRCTCSLLHAKASARSNSARKSASRRKARGSFCIDCARRAAMNSRNCEASSKSTRRISVARRRTSTNEKSSRPGAAQSVRLPCSACVSVAERRLPSRLTM